MDSHAKHGQSLKQIFWMNGEFLCRKSYFQVGAVFLLLFFFFDRGSNDMYRREWNSLKMIRAAEFDLFVSF